MGDIRVLCEACEKGKFIVNKCLKNGYDINTEKLEKLLIIMQGEMLRLYRKPFFLQPIIVNDKDVIIPKVEDSFSMYNDGFKERLCEYYHLTKEDQEIMDMVFASYAQMDINDLNEKREINILKSLYIENEWGLNIISNDQIKNIFIRSRFFENDFIKPNHNVKQKVLAIK